MKRCISVLPLLCACIVDVEVGAQCLLITEVMSAEGQFIFDSEATDDATILETDGGPTDDSDDYRPDWIEVCNLGDVRARTEIYRIVSHDQANPFAPLPVTLPVRNLRPQGCELLVADPGRGGSPHVLPFDLEGTSDGFLRLEGIGEAGGCVQNVDYPPLAQTLSYSRIDGDWQVTREPTPGDLR